MERLLCCKRRKARDFYPEVHLNAPNENLNLDFPSNRISSTKYTLLTFLPKNLYEQFRRLSNFYFLLIAVISLVKSIAPITPIATWPPLIFVLAVSAIKDAVEDFGRWRSDNLVNNRLVEVLRDETFVKIANKHVKVGDIVCVHRDEQVPVDGVILATSDVEGMAYVDTANLDGETNLKAYKARPETKSLTRAMISHLQATVNASVNTPTLNRFRGNLELIPNDNVLEAQRREQKEKSVEISNFSNFSFPSEKLALDERNLLLRGSVLRNTRECYVGVVYAGMETKVQLNANNPPSKFSETDRIINRVVVAIFIFKVLACTGCAIAAYMFERKHARAGANGYLPTGSSAVWRGFLTFWAYFALFAFFIPISLIVTLELAKLFQAMFMMWDAQMASDDGKLMSVNNSNLNDELARVGYIFCDKTGTLTENRMVFDKASIDGVAYRNARNKELFNIVDPDSSATDGDRDRETVLKVLDFVILLALANTSQVEHYNPEEEAELKLGNGRLKRRSKEKKMSNGDGEVEFELEEEEDMAMRRTWIRYQAQSPDDICLCNFARDNGVTLKERRNTALVVDVLGEEKVFEILQIFEFSSERRRMSVLLRQPDGQIVVYSKGADATMMERLASHVDADLCKSTQQHADEFSQEGLRTLICCKKLISDDQYESFAAEYNNALAMVEGRDEKVEELADVMERDFELVGCTAIEDKLQERVPETISYFIAAGIKVWIITGDKQATAINIAKASNLIQSEARMIVVNVSSDAECNEALDDALNVLSSEPRVTLVIDGPSLAFAFTCGGKFLAVSEACESVVVCRATPLQKALVVRMMKLGTVELTLSIGDGANDVSMLHEAHIGVGVFGKEGSQAARSGDYAIHQFSHLQRLVCIHGRYNLLRSSLLIQFCFYKNVAMFLGQLWYSFFNGFSAQPVYEAFTMTVFNALISATPPFCVGIFERDVSERMIERFPQAHEEMKREKAQAFTYGNYLLHWASPALYHSLVVFFVPFFVFSQASTTSTTGRAEGYWLQALTTYSGGLLTILLKIALVAHWWNWIVHASIWGSALVFTLLFWLLSASPASPMSGIFETFWTTPACVFCMLLVPCLALFPDFLLAYLKRNYFPNAYHILQEMDDESEEENGETEMQALMGNSTNPSSKEDESI